MPELRALRARDAPLRVSLRLRAIYYAQKPQGGTWTQETVQGHDGSVGTGFHSLAFDAMERPWILMEKRSATGTPYAAQLSRRLAAGWSSETVSSPDYQYFASLGLYRSGPSAPWRIQTVDATGEVGDRCDITVDAQNAPHIVYLDGAGVVKYAH